MVAISRVNPNFPIPGIDQSSRGFRDNFATIKSEIEAIQSKVIVLTGDVTSSNVIIDSGTGDVVIDTTISIANATAGGANLSIQYNDSGIINGADGFMYDPASNFVGIGTTAPVLLLDVWGQAIVRNQFVVGSNAGTPGFGTAYINSLNGAIQFGSVGPDNIQIQIGNIDIANFGPTGLAIGVGTSGAVRQLDVASNMPDIAWFYGNLDTSDNGVRFTTDQSTSSIGLILDQTAANAVGGIRVGTDGNVTIHAGENTGAQLSNSSARITITGVGQVGIGSTAPVLQLDVAGGVLTTSPSAVSPIPVVTDTPAVAYLIDDYNTTVFRSANYTVQVTDTDTGDVDLTSVLLMHANGTDYLYTYANIASNGSLGTIGSAINGDQAELTFTPSVNNTEVKISATYIAL